MIAGTNIVGWALALCGVACGVMAASIKGGPFEAWTAASLGLNGLAAAWGYTSRKGV